MHPLPVGLRCRRRILLHRRPICSGDENGPSSHTQTVGYYCCRRAERLAPSVHGEVRLLKKPGTDGSGMFRLHEVRRQYVGVGKDRVATAARVLSKGGVEGSVADVQGDWRRTVVMDFLASESGPGANPPAISYLATDVGLWMSLPAFAPALVIVGVVFFIARRNRRREPGGDAGPTPSPVVERNENP